jgi:hypothetical protein
LRTDADPLSPDGRGLGEREIGLKVPLPYIPSRQGRGVFFALFMNIRLVDFERIKNLRSFWSDPIFKLF